jgi:succinate dehydrogenase hydrophobic anchor subunit
MWWMQRITAVLLLVASLGLGLLGYLGFGLYLLFLCVMTFVIFLHVQLGMQCIVEDYVHTKESVDLAVFLIRVGCIVQAKSFFLFFADTESTAEVIGGLVNSFVS